MGSGRYEFCCDLVKHLAYSMLNVTFENFVAEN